jgi:glutamine amidotransferase
MQVVIIDLGVGNLRSVAQAVLAVAPDSNVLVSAEAGAINNADKVILPGQGAVGSWFRELRARGVENAVMQALASKPVLGICVGMQALFDYCEEDGGQPGLGLFDGEVKHFRHFHPSTANERISIPQMGWNQVAQSQPHPLWQGIEENSHFYFLHSYCANLRAGADPSVVVGTADYHHRYIAAVARDNVFATQFHPEKSHNDGLQLFRNFTRWDGQV